MYPPGHDSWVTVERLSAPLCGAFRPGHFRGVATVVLKLLNLVRPARAYFGRKDYQQVKVVERMVADLNLPVKIVPCPTVREPDGLALSSRNAFLSLDERRAASRVPSALRAAVQVVQSAPRVSVDKVRRAALRALVGPTGIVPQYVVVADPDTLAPLREVRGRALIALAVHVGKTRLIDNAVVA
jgi:pantoate--beta-alanine ligase